MIKKCPLTAIGYVHRGFNIVRAFKFSFVKIIISYINGSEHVRVLVARMNKSPVSRAAKGNPLDNITRAHSSPVDYISLIIKKAVCAVGETTGCKIAPFGKTDSGTKPSAYDPCARTVSALVKNPDCRMVAVKQQHQFTIIRKKGLLHGLHPEVTLTTQTEKFNLGADLAVFNVK